MKLIALCLIVFVVVLVIRNPNRRDAEVDEILEKARKIRDQKLAAGEPLTVEDIALSRARQRLD